MQQTFNTDTLVKIIATYGVIHIVASDLGAGSSDKHNKIIQSPLVLAAIMYATAKLATEDDKLALITVAIYYAMRYAYVDKSTMKYLL